MNDRVLGVVKWFSNERGYGFVNVDSDADKKDYFVHYSYINLDGYKTLRAGQKVSFALISDDRGVQAREVKIEE